MIGTEVRTSIAIFLLPHRPGGHAVLAGRGHLRLADEHVGAGRRGLAKGNFDGLGGLAAGHAADVDRQLTGGAVLDGDAVEGVHGDAGSLKDRARVLAGTRPRLRGWCRRHSRRRYGGGRPAE